jgi:hypothetical protein
MADAFSFPGNLGKILIVQNRAKKRSRFQDPIRHPIKKIKFFYFLSFRSCFFSPSAVSVFSCKKIRRSRVRFLGGAEKRREGGRFPPDANRLGKSRSEGPSCRYVVRYIPSPPPPRTGKGQVQKERKKPKKGKKITSSYSPPPGAETNPLIFRPTGFFRGRRGSFPKIPVSLDCGFVGDAGFRGVEGAVLFIPARRKKERKKEREDEGRVPGFWAARDWHHS